MLLIAIATTPLPALGTNPFDPRSPIPSGRLTGRRPINLSSGIFPVSSAIVISTPTEEVSVSSRPWVFNDMGGRFEEKTKHYGSKFFSDNRADNGRFGKVGIFGVWGTDRLGRGLAAKVYLYGNDFHEAMYLIHGTDAKSTPAQRQVSERHDIP